MPWNWEQSDWPDFRWDAARLEPFEREFLLCSGTLIGSTAHFAAADALYVIVEALSDEALATSQIEGEILDRASVQSSVRRQFGLADDNKVSKPKERGIAEMLVQMYKTSAAPLSNDTLFAWHRLVMSGSDFAVDVGRFRASEAPMQIVSGNLVAPTVHFEAPPADRLPADMERFVDWFNQTGTGGDSPTTALVRAGTAHIYFESIHPFDDGNGRIGRALAEKALAQSLGQPALTLLGATLLKRRKEYYAALEVASRTNEITNWLVWFSEAAIEASRSAVALVNFVIEKAKLMDALRGQMNERQEKALLRMFAEGPAGFRGGMNAGKYATITGASPATATRDLADIVAKGGLTKTGELRHARYYLPMKFEPS